MGKFYSHPSLGRGYPLVATALAKAMRGSFVIDVLESGFFGDVWYGWFGDQTVYVDTLPSGNNRASVKQYVLPQDSTITSITQGFTAATTAGTSMRGVIYADDGGLPGAIVAVGSIVAIPAGASLVVSLIDNVLLPAGTYWLGSICNNGTAYHAHSTAGTGDGINSQMADGTTHNANFLSPVNWPGSSASYDYNNTTYADYYVGIAPPAPVEANLTCTLGPVLLSSTATIDQPAGGGGVVGDDTAGASTFPASSDRAILSDFTMPADGDGVTGYLRFDSTSTAGTSAKFLVYADNGSGQPGALLYASTAQAVPGGGGILTYSVSVPGLTNGQIVWLGGVCDNFTAVFQVDVSGGLSRMESTTYATPAATWVEAAPGTPQVNAWMDYESAGGGGIEAGLTVALGAVTLAATAKVGLAANLSVSLGQIVFVSDVKLGVRANAPTIAIGAVGFASTAILTSGLTANASIALGEVTLASTAKLDVKAGASNTLGAVTLASSARLGLKAQSSISLDPVQLASTARLTVSAGSTNVLGAVVVAATSRLAVGAQAAIALGPVVLAATAQLIAEPGRTANMSVALGAIGFSSTTKLDLKANSSILLDSVTLAATARLSVRAGATVTLGAVTLASQASLRVEANSNNVLGPVGFAAVAALSQRANATIALGSIGFTSTAKIEVPIRANAAIQLGAITFSATGTVTGAGIVSDQTIKFEVLARDRSYSVPARSRLYEIKAP